MHLTNYSLNKHAENFADSEDDDKGSKRTISWLRSWLQGQGRDWAECWAQIGHLVVKALLTAQPSMEHKYRACFASNGPVGRCGRAAPPRATLPLRCPPPPVCSLAGAPSASSAAPLPPAGWSRSLSDLSIPCGIYCDPPPRPRPRPRPAAAAASTCWAST